MRALRTDTVAALGLTLAVWLAYGNSFNGAFQFDDYNVIVHESTVHGWSQWFADLGHGIRPLLKLTYLLDWASDTDTTAFHLTNLLIHLANSWLVYLLSLAFITRDEHLRRFTSLPLLIALLFAMHPVNTEAVTYISGRSASLMSLFYLGGLLLYVQGSAHRSRVHLHLLTPLCFLLALLTKETAVTFPAALLLWDVCTGQSWRDTIAKQWSSWTLLLVAALFFLFSQSYQSQMLNSVHFNTFGGNVATQLSGVVWLLRQWTLPLWLNIDPDLPVYRQVLDAPVSLFAVAVMLAASRHFRSSRPWITFALLWTLLQLVPLYLLLPRLDVANERQLYLAGWPLCLAAFIEISLLLKIMHVRTVITAILLVCALLTLQRNQDYKSETALWETAVLASPDKARVHNNLGYAYLLAGRNNEARRAFERALQLDPQHVQAAGNLRRLKNSTPGAGSGVL